MHFFRAFELQRLAESCGLTTLEMVGCEGLSTGLPEATNTVAEDPTKWERWVELVLETATEPAIVDMAAHILYIGGLAKISFTLLRDAVFTQETWRRLPTL